MKHEEISFETVLRAGDVVIITDVCMHKNITYFKANGHQFQTYDDKVHHKHSPMYDHVLSEIWARDSHEPEAIAERDDMMARVNRDTELWWRHRLDVFKAVFPLALKIQAEYGDQAFLDFLDANVFITAEDGAQKIIDRLENHKP